MANLSNTNVPPETGDKFFLECLPIWREMKDAQEVARSHAGRLREVYKRAKESGVNQKAIARLLKERQLDPEDVAKDERDYIRMAARIGAFPREQISMFAEILEETGDEATKQTISLDRIYDDGLFSGTEAKKNRSDNPHPAGTEENATWDRGYMMGQQKNAQGLAPKMRAKAAPKPRVGKGGKGKPAPDAEQQPAA